MIPDNADVRSFIYENFAAATWEACTGGEVSAVCADSTSGLDVLDELGRVVYVLYRVLCISKARCDQNDFQSCSRFRSLSFLYSCNSGNAVLSFRRRRKLLSIWAFCLSLVQSTRFFTLLVSFTRRARSPRSKKPRKNKSLRTVSGSSSAVVLSRVVYIVQYVPGPRVYLFVVGKTKTQYTCHLVIVSVKSTV